MIIEKLCRQLKIHEAFFKNVFWMYLLQMAQYVLPFITFPYLTRTLRPESFAVYAFVIAFMGLIGIVVNFGFNLSGTRAVSAVRNNKEDVSRIVGEITYARLTVAGVLLLVVCGVCPFVELLRDNTLFSILSYVGIVLGAILPDFVFQSYEKMKSLTTRYLLTKSLSVFGIFLFIHGPDDLIKVAMINIVCGLVGYLWTLSAMRKTFDVTTDWKAIGGVFKQLRMSSLYCFSNLSSSLFSGFITVMIGVILPDKTQVAYWSLAITAVTAVQMLYSPIADSLYPHMINGKDLRFAYRLGLVAAPVLAIGTALFIFLADFIVAILGGPEYRPAARILIWLSPILPMSFYGIFIGWPILGALGQVKLLTLSTVVSGLTNVVLMSSLALLNISSMALVCAIRCFVELLMLVLRAAFLYKTLREDKRDYKLL